MEYLSDKDAINMFSEILKFPTISGIGPTTGSYDLCAAWILEKCNAIGLNTFILPESLPNKPIVVAEWEGTDSTLPCILFNSHYDVVPVTEDAWNVPTFEGVLIDDKIYGRGAQDMKCVVVQYIVAFGRLKAIGHQPVRTLRLSFVPDEEIGGADGMGILLKSQWFNDKKIAIAFDEVCRLCNFVLNSPYISNSKFIFTSSLLQGLASEDNNFAVFYGERLPWWIKVKCYFSCEICIYLLL
jgi:aminoacylase